MPLSIDRFHLRHRVCRATDTSMKLRVLAAVAALVLLPSCRHEEEAVVTETRRVTLRDIAPKLNASSNERFRNTRPSPVQAPTPAGWLEVPATEFRLLNYRFGEAGSGEVWVSVARGGLLDNLNRWLGQFDHEPIGAETLQKWSRIPVGVDQEGVWVEAQGTYSPGMGQLPRADQALAGIIVEAEGGLLTIKMVGPLGDVEAQKPVLKAFAKTMIWNSN